MVSETVMKRMEPLTNAVPAVLSSTGMVVPLIVAMESVLVVVVVVVVLLLLLLLLVVVVGILLVVGVVLGEVSSVLVENVNKKWH